jgi:hypothetical protein
LAIVEQNKILRDLLREFAKTEIAPNAMKWDEQQAFPLEIASKLGELGMMGVIMPPQYGGAGLSYPEYVDLSKTFQLKNIIGTSNSVLSAKEPARFNEWSSPRKSFSDLEYGSLLPLC